jgi:hypothetical protein
MQQAEYNHQDFNHSQQSKQDELLFVKFFIKSVEDKAKSLEAGRPIFKDVEYVDIRVSGKRDSLACRPARHQDLQRFAKHYDLFKSRTEMPIEGTPLSEWPQISRSQIEELSFLNCKTIEQLCEMSDTHVSQFRGGYSLKEKAKQWMKAADKSKMLARNQKLESEVEELKAAVALLTENQKQSEVAESVAKTVATKTKAKAKKKA